MEHFFLGEVYQVTRPNGVVISFKFLGDRDNVNDATEIISSNTDKLPTGTIISIDVLLAVPYIQISRV